MYAILQDASEQEWQFCNRPISVFFSQFDHGILNNIQSSIIVANGVDRLLKGTLLYTTQKVR
jgi:hypothetical protein